MVSKLMKYEFKATSMIFLPLFAAAICLSFLTFMAFKISGVFGGISTFLMVIVLIAMVALSFVIAIQRFYKGIYGSEGYLFMSLPESPNAHIASKLLVSSAWIYAALIVLLISVFIAVGPANALNAVTQILRTIHLEMQAMGINVFAFWGFIVGIIIIGIPAGLLSIFTAISIGCQAPKHRIPASFAAYVVIGGAIDIISMVFIALMLAKGVGNFGSDLMNNPEYISTYVTSIFAFEAILLILTGIGFYLATNYFMKKKFNIE